MKPIDYCIRCNKPMDKAGKHCKACVKEKRYINNEKYEKDNSKYSLCFVCRKPLDRKGKRCIKCNEKHNKRDNELYKIKKANNLCRKCKTPVLDGKNYCPACRIIVNKQQTVWRNIRLKKARIGLEDQ